MAVEAEAAGEVLIPPDNFAMVAPGVYRSGFPKRKNLPFLQSIGLRSILTLVLEEYPDINRAFNEEQNIRLFQFGVPGNKEPFVDINPTIILLAVEQLLDVRNHPILIHCNKGKHRTGCLVGCLRKACGWNLCSILDEYIRFSHPKSRFMDQQFIELFDVNRVRLKRRYIPGWLPSVSQVSGPGAQALVVDGALGGAYPNDLYSSSAPGGSSVDKKRRKRKKSMPRKSSAVSASGAAAAVAAAGSSPSMGRRSSSRSVASSVEEVLRGVAGGAGLQPPAAAAATAAAAAAVHGSTGRTVRTTDGLPVTTHA